MATEPGAHTAFWRFSTRVYAAPGVKAACLALQARGGDVNLALWIVWIARQEQDPRGALGEARSLSRIWREAVVQPVRNARNALKPAPGFADPLRASALRKTLLSAELDAEQVQQDMLYALSPACPRSSAAPDAIARAGLCAYGAAEGLDLDAAGFAETLFTTAEKL